MVANITTSSTRKFLMSKKLIDTLTAIPASNVVAFCEHTLGTSKGIHTYQITGSINRRNSLHNRNGKVITLDQAMDQLTVNVAFSLKLFRWELVQNMSEKFSKLFA